MPTKNKKPQQDDIVTLPVDNEQKRLRERAFDQGVLARTRRVCSTTMKPTKQMTRADGKDIVKKSSSRRNRYLLVFNCQIAPAAAGRLGTLAQLDSRNPVMYIDFADGRLKLFGTLTFPNNKYMVLKLGNKEALCEDILESMIVFSEAWWVGSVADNPEEHRLPMPSSLKEPQHAKYHFNSRGELDDKDGVEAALDEENLMDESDEDVPATQRPQRASTRTARGKRQRYCEESGNDGTTEDESEDSGVPAQCKLPRVQSTSHQKRCQQQKLPGRIDSQKDRADTDDRNLVGGEGAAVGGKPKQGTLDAFVKHPAAMARTTPQKAARGTSSRASRLTPGGKGGGEREVRMDLAVSSGGEEGSGEEQIQPPPSSARPQRAAAGAAAKRLRVESDSDDGGSQCGGGGRGKQRTLGGGELDESGAGGSSDAGGKDWDGEDTSKEESDYQPSD